MGESAYSIGSPDLQKIQIGHRFVFGAVRRNRTIDLRIEQVHILVENAVQVCAGEVRPFDRSVAQIGAVEIGVG